MEVKLRKLWPLIGALCVTAFAPSFAQSNYGSSSNGSGSSYGSSMDSSSGQSGQQGTYQRGTFREITPNAGPRVAHGADVFITTNFIWWKATQDGLQDAITGVALGNSAPLASPTSGIEKRGSVQTPDFKWKPGFKVGLGLNLGHDGWDIFAQYTWFHTGTSSNSTNGIGISNFVTSVASTSNFQTSGNVKRSDSWDLSFNVIDLELGRNFYASQFLTLRPFIGFKGTWQDQDYKFNANPAEGAVFGGLPVNGLYQSHQKHDAWGLGVRAGLNSGWYLNKSWSIYGNVAWSAVWTHYDVDRKDHITLTDDPATYYQVVNTNYDAYRVRYVGELELGLRWELWFYDDNYHFSVQAGWEEQVWINYGSNIRLYNDAQGDLSLHGLNLKFRFDF
jgi:hypothetical protein